MVVNNACMKCIIALLLALAVSIPASATAGEGIAPQPAEVGYRPTHPYFTVPYSVNPSFSVSIPYDFSVYDALPGYLNRLQRCKDSIECVLGNVSVIEQENHDFDWIVSYGGNVLSEDLMGLPEYPAWEAYCERPDQHAVNSLAEAVDNCARSQDRDCVCAYALPIIPPEEINKWSGRGLSAGLSLIPLVGPILGIATLAATELADAAEWDERVIALARSGSGVRVSMRSHGTPGPQVVPNAMFKQVDSGLRGASSNELRYVVGDAGKVVDLYKDRQNNITIYPQGAAPSSAQCQVHNKMVKFCIVQDRSFLAYNSQDNRMGIQQLVLKFAYLFRSQVTDVGGFRVLDAPFSSGKLLLLWEPVEGVDVEHYTIYRSENPAMESNLLGQSPASVAEDVRAELSPLELRTADRQDISIAEASLLGPLCIMDRTTCSLGYRLETAIGEEVSPAMLEDNVLYYSTAAGKFFYLLPGLQNGFDYFFAITATDTNGDESPSFNIPERFNHEAAEDDVPPGLADIRDVRLDGGSVVFNIGPLGYNIDGTPLDPSLVTKYRIYCFEDVAEGEFDLSQRESVFGERVESNLDGSVTFYRPLSDFTAYSCGFTSSLQSARFVVAGVKTVRGVDISYDKNVMTNSFSAQPVTIPET
jgi:hypothetical protein